MKFNVEIDCTPEEVRQLMGLPDMQPIHDHFQSQMKDVLEKGLSPDVMETMVKSWMPMGQNSLDMFRSIMSPFADGSKMNMGDEKPPRPKS